MSKPIPKKQNIKAITCSTLNRARTTQRNCQVEQHVYFITSFLATTWNVVYGAHCVDYYTEKNQPNRQIDIAYFGKITGTRTSKLTCKWLNS